MTDEMMISKQMETKMKDLDWWSTCVASYKGGNLILPSLIRDYSNGL